MSEGSGTGGERWRRVSQLFATALERPPQDRSAFLDAMAGEPDLRHELESLLAAHDTVGPLDQLGAQMEQLRREAVALSTVDPAAMGAAQAGGTRPPMVEPGERLGRYAIHSRLGAGGMGEVYQALDTRLQREVAIKVLGRRVRDRPDALRRFEEEARAASALNHPNIVTVHDIGEEGSFPYIVMELVEGASLRQMLSEPWPAELLLHLAAQIADGLVAAHERRIVHRDIKPENILVTRQGIAKILDFGLAQIRLAEEVTAGPDAASAGQQPTRRDGLIGTPGYMSPELISGETVDFRADQFSFGAILYEMATGKRAFAGQTALESIALTVGTDPPPLALARPELPPAFAQAVSRCLRKAPGERYGSTRELMDQLRAARRAAFAASPLPGRPPPLPAQRNAFVGRRHELEAIKRLIVEEEVRLVTLTGPGGTGKTRLALQVVEELSPRFAGRVAFIPLTTITDPELVGPAVAQALGSVVPSGRSALSVVIADLRGAQAPTLLLLDNLEQVIEGASVVSDLLAACPELSVITTSREILRLYGEHDFPVHPLERPDPERLPSLDELAAIHSVTLFVDRARAANPAFRLTSQNAPAVAELCARLDGLPLALELAAAQVRRLSPEAMLSRLERRLALLTGGPRDLPGRHQALRRTLDWSHQLLDATEQALFRRLAVFAGGFTLEAAQAVADPYGNLQGDVAGGVGALADKSLVQAGGSLEGEPLYSMLETIREYALEKLEESGEEARTRKAHAAYFVVLAEEGRVALASSEPPQWLKRFESEQANFRAALDWLTEQGDADWGLRIALALFPFWERGEHVAEARRRFRALLDLAAAQPLREQRARALFAAAALAYSQGDSEAGLELDAQCLRLYRELGDARGVATALVALANQHAGRREYDTARDYLDQGLEVARGLADRTVSARCLSNLAYVARMQGRLDEARDLYQKAAAMFESLGDRLGCAWAFDFEGDVARQQGDLDAAEALYEKALAAFRALAYPWGIGSALADRATIARQRGRHGEAGQLCRDALVTFVEIGHRRGIARLLESLACLLAEEGQAERGLRLAAAAATLRDRLGAAASPAERAELERSLSTMRQSLGREAAERVWLEGATAQLEHIIRLASEEAQGSAQ